MTPFIKRLKTEIGTFNNFVNILGAGTKLKHRKLFNYCAYFWQVFVEGILQVVLLMIAYVSSLKKHRLAKILLAFERHFYTKIVATAIPTHFVTNSLLSLLYILRFLRN